jgi:ribonucleoside-diphosphate reductase alpha chain
MESETLTHVIGLLPTPPIPEGLPEVEFSENSKQVLTRRYLRRGKDGNPIESIEGMFWRIAYHVANTGSTDEVEVRNRAVEFYRIMSSKSFFPNSPTFTGAGTPLGQLAACFVLPVTDDMGRAPDGIFSTLRNAALIQQTGGGNGFDFSKLRPKGSLVNTSAGEATGPVGFLRVYDHAFGEIAQGGTRRGANMGVLRVDHPDVLDFITCKTDENSITNFNISVGITDDFMEAVVNDSEWALRFPDVNSPNYKGFNGTIETAAEKGIPIVTHKTIPAKELFYKIVTQAHHNGEPGMLFLDTANRSNPVPHLYELEATNPCGEQWLGPYENCCLGSLNLKEYFGPNGTVDWTKLAQDTELATTFLDNVVDVNAYVPVIPKLRESAQNARRIGLGFMGLADLMYHVGVRYGSERGQEFAMQVVEFIRYHAMRTSIDLARTRGAFPAIKGSIYDPSNLTWTPPKPQHPYQDDWSRPELDWNKITYGILQYGIRNAAQTTVAPTGTIATVAGCEGYGCEPVFALAYVRHVNDKGKDLELTYVSPLFQDALDQAELTPEAKLRIIEKVLENGSCQQCEELPDAIRNIFVVSSDITADEHLYMQAAMQTFVDNSLSKTINFPAGTSVDEVARAYQLAWQLGCKGVTVYVTGSREKVVLETKATQNKKKADTLATMDDGWDGSAVDETQLSFWQDAKKPRPRTLKGYTFSIETPLGKAFVTINENGSDQPFEVFINTAKAGSETAAHSEAIGRLISYVLRLSSPVEPKERLKVVMEQLAGIGGGRSLGFGPNRVRSLPDGIAKALDDYLYQQHWEKEVPTVIQEAPPAFSLPVTATGALKIGELCPECGQATLINEEGCKKCYTCAFSEC